jgi:hypothetical protein
LIAIAFFAPGNVVAALTMRSLGYTHSKSLWLMLLGAPLGALCYILFTPPIYKHFRLLPLFLPVCPHCKRRPDRYRVVEATWPRARVACDHCQQLTDHWWRAPLPSEISPTVPSPLLSWPQSIGRWRLISRLEE